MLNGDQHPTGLTRSGEVLLHDGEVKQVNIAIGIKIAERTAFGVDTSGRGHARAYVLDVENPIAIAVRRIEHQVVDTVTAASLDTFTGEFDSHNLVSRHGPVQVETSWTLSPYSGMFVNNGT